MRKYKQWRETLLRCRRQPGLPRRANQGTKQRGTLCGYQGQPRHPARQSAVCHSRSATATTTATALAGNIRPEHDRIALAMVATQLGERLVDRASTRYHL